MSQQFIKYLKGKKIIREGDISTNMFYVKSGSLSVQKAHDGTIIELGKIKAGQLIGEMSFLDKKTRSATVIAESDCEILTIESAKFEALLKQLPEWLTLLQKQLIERLRDLDNKA